MSFVKPNVLRLCASATLLFTFSGALLAQPRSNRPTTFLDAIGSWMGRAVPVPGKTICVPGSPGCTVPPEIVMVFTVSADGTFIGIDSNIFVGGTHTTAHGQWTIDGIKSIKAAFTFLQSGPNDVFIGGFKNIFKATPVSPDRMEGTIDAYLYQYTNPATGQVIVDADGFPVPNPLAPPSACATTAGCVPLGQFSFKVRRVSAP